MAKKKRNTNITPATNSNKTEQLPEKARVRSSIKYEQTLTRIRQDIANWRSQLLAAESVQFPNRTGLYTLFKDVEMDAHIDALIQTRKRAMLSSKYRVFRNGVCDEEKTNLIRKKWFYDFINYALDSIFWGYSLVQFGDIVNGEFTDIELVPRQYVKQEFSLVVANPFETTGNNYTEEPFKSWVLGIGEKRNLGVLAKAAPLYIWRKGAWGAWSQFAEGYGVPFRWAKTNTRDEATRSEVENMLKNLAGSAYGVVDLEDEINILELKNADVYLVFDKLIERCESDLSKLILGQTSTSDQKSYVGSSAVHERVFHLVNEADEIFLENIFTYQLIPFLNQHGFGMEGCTIEAEQDDNLTLQEKAKIDLELLKFYEIDPAYIEEVYGTPVSKKASPEPGITPIDPGVEVIKNKLRDIYGD